MHTVEKVDLSVLPEKAQEELYDFFLFLKQRYQNEKATLHKQNKTAEHKAWQTIIENNKKRKFYVAPSVDIRALIDEASNPEI